MMQTPTASEVVMGEITITNVHDADAGSERGGDGGDRYQQWR